MRPWEEMTKKMTDSVRIFTTAFVGGILTLGLEIVAGRILAPFFGSSLHQWAALIGIILIAYGVGYETYRQINRWGPALPFALGGLYILSLPLWLFPLLDAILNFPLSLASLSGALLTSGLPSILWASVLPFLQKENKSGSSRVLAWSTCGNLVGVWGVAFVGIPEMGTRFTLLCLGMLSLLISLLWISTLKPLSKATALLLSLLLLGGGATLSQASLLLPLNDPETWPIRHLFRPDAETHSLELLESAYQQISIWTGEFDHQLRTALMLNGNVQFIWSKDEKLTRAGSRYEYYNYATAAAYWTNNGPAQSMLSLGVAGGIIPWQIRQFLPGIELTGFELDSTLAEVSKKKLPLSQIGAIDLEIGDARFLLQHTQKKFDYILMDCYLSSYIPYHLTTREFFELVKSHLNPGGIVAANFHTVFAESSLLSKLEKTMASTFKAVISVDLPSGITFAIGSADETALEERIQRAKSFAPAEFDSYNLEALNRVRQTPPPVSSDPGILTDDHNNTEQLLFETRKFVQVRRVI